MKTGNQAVLNSGAGAAGMVAAAEELPLSSTMEHAATDIYEVDPLRDPRWSSLVESHPRTSVFHSTNWLRALSNVYGYKPIAVTTCSPEAVLTNGIVFCRIESWLTGRRFVSLPFSDHCEPLVESADELDHLLLRMQQALRRNKWKYIEIRPRSWEPSNRTGLSRSLTYHFHRLDLDRSTEDLFRKFHKDCVQRKIRRAERGNLRYEEGRSEDLLRDFYNLLVITRRRHYLPPQPLSWFRGLIAAFGNSLKIRVAYKDRLPVASILTLSHRASMVYKYGCSNAEFSNLGGTALLFWKTIQEAKECGFEELDMGRSDIENPGLIAFKEHWGATGTLLTYWTYPQKPDVSRSTWQKRLTNRIVSVSPDLVLQAAGTLLYRHIG